VVFEEVSCPYELDRLPCYEDNNGWPAGIPEFCAANTEGATNAPITTGTSQPTLSPTTHPTHQPAPQSVPTPTPPTPTGGEFCCTDDFLNCRSETDYCSESESNCNNCNSNWMIPQGQCIARWGDCGNDPSGWLLQPWAVHAVAQWAARSMPRKWRLLSVHEGLIRRV